MFTVFLCTYRVLCSSVHQYIQFVFFVAFAFGGGGKREEGGGERQLEELHQKVKKSMYAYSLFWQNLSFGTPFLPIFFIFTEKNEKKSIQYS